EIAVCASARAFDGIARFRGAREAARGAVPRAVLGRRPGIGGGRRGTGLLGLRGPEEARDLRPSRRGGERPGLQGDVRPRR
ncbi:MAG: hypothetical protein AVDCRST_MAG05-3572, partial [uncultured Rubrobacteraceae bacterium]